jgi:hypothetical protein
MNHPIGAELEGPLVERCRDRVVDDDRRSGGTRAFDGLLQIDEPHERIGGCLDQYRARVGYGFSPRLALRRVDDLEGQAVDGG